MDEGFNLLVNGGSRVEQLPVQHTVNFEYSTIRLENADVLTHEITTKMQNHEVDGVSKPLKPQDIQFFKPKVTSKRSAKQMFTTLERWYAKHVVNKYYRKQPELRAHMDKLLTTNPVGITDPPNDDKICWDAVTVLTAAQPTGGTGGTVIPGQGRVASRSGIRV